MGGGAVLRRCLPRDGRRACPAAAAAGAPQRAAPAAPAGRGAPGGAGLRRRRSRVACVCGRLCAPPPSRPCPPAGSLSGHYSAVGSPVALGARVCSLSLTPESRAGARTLETREQSQGAVVNVNKP